VREAALFGVFGDRLNVTDGRYTLYDVPRRPEAPVYEYTLMPTAMKDFIGLHMLSQAELVPPFAWTQNCPLLKLPYSRALSREADGQSRSLLFDVQADPRQECPMNDSAVSARMEALLRGLLQANDAPPELWDRHFGAA
jgi:hypothetical protein